MDAKLGRRRERARARERVRVRLYPSARDLGYQVRKNPLENLSNGVRKVLSRGARPGLPGGHEDPVAAPRQSISSSASRHITLSTRATLSSVSADSTNHLFIQNLQHFSKSTRDSIRSYKMIQQTCQNCRKNQISKNRLIMKN